MSATYLFSIGGAAKSIQPDWSLAATANGRNRFQCRVKSIDGSYRPAYDDEVTAEELVAIVSSSVANPTVVTTVEPHGLVTGEVVVIAGHTGSTPSLNGGYLATVTSATTFTVPVNVTVAGSGGTSSRTIFSGPANSTREMGLGGLATPILTEVTAVDGSAVTEHRYVNTVLLAGTLKSMLTTLVTNYLPMFSLHALQVNGPALPNVPCDYMILRDVLDLLCNLSNGYVWEIDEHGRLRAFLPNTETAPFNVIDGDGHALGDITVEPTRSGYTNRVIMRFNNAAIAAYAFLTTSGNFGNTETVVIGSKTYTFQTVLTDVDGHVLIGATAEDSLDNLVAAITLGAGSGSTYAASTTVHPTVTAYVLNPSNLKAIAITPGAAGNSTACTDTAANASWTTEGGGATSTLLFGADEALTNVAIAEDVPSQAPPTYIWETVLQSDTTSLSLAQSAADAYLAVHLVVPKKVTYQTEALGLRPGQVQTITIARRNVNNTFVITDVNARAYMTKSGGRVQRTVTAIESVLVDAAPRWRDVYKQWSGTASGSSASVSVTGGGGGGVVAGILYPFGGSDIEWVQTTSGSWTPGSSIEIRIDSVARGSRIGTCYVRLRARSGSVTARMRNTSDGATVGTSAAVTSTSFVTVSFGVLLTAGSKLYQIELSPGSSNVDVQLGSGYFE